jgi:hypothetical protein
VTTDLPDWARGPGAWALGIDPSLEEINDAADVQDDSFEVIASDETVAHEGNVEVGLLARPLHAELHAGYHPVEAFPENLTVLDWSGIRKPEAHKEVAAFVWNLQGERSHDRDGDMEFSVLIAIAHRTKNGEWIVFSRLAPPLIGLEPVDIAPMSRRDSREHLFAIRLPTTLPIVRLVQEDWELGAQLPRVSAVLDCESKDEVIERRTSADCDFSRVETPLGRWRTIDPHSHNALSGDVLNLDTAWTSILEPVDFRLERVELLLRSREFRSATG